MSPRSAVAPLRGKLHSPYFPSAMHRLKFSLVFGSHTFGRPLHRSAPKTVAQGQSYHPAIKLGVSLNVCPELSG
eukprot:1953059-Amphidinium_carterae.3